MCGGQAGFRVLRGFVGHGIPTSLSPRPSFMPGASYHNGEQRQSRGGGVKKDLLSLSTVLSCHTQTRHTLAIYQRLTASFPVSSLFVWYTERVD
jgi:hypothetical protein